MNYLPHQQRVVDEKEQLADRLGKLRAFFDNKIFDGLPHAEKDRLRRQAVYMAGYECVLDERIAAFPAN